MKVYLIKASAPGPFKEYKKYMGSPPQNIFSAAAATPKGVKIDMCDETSGMKPKKRTDADVVALFFHTPDAVHAYKMADAYRAKGKIVALAGLHPSFMPDEAAQHADTVLIGEIEGIWGQMLRDVKNGELKKRYERSKPVDMAKLKPYPTDIIPPSRYNGVWSVLVSRGCPHRCEFCVVPPMFKGKYRLRPVEDVVAEIKAAPADWFELHADNLTANRDYAVQLFKALAPLNINWVGESTIKMAEDAELLKLAQESGCKVLLIGIETPSQAALSDSGKGFVDPAEIRNRIRKFHDHGIQITSSMIFGIDGQTKDIFKESVDFCREIDIDEVEAAILTPFAGTPLYKRMKAEGRLLTDDWAKYDCDHAVFRPKGMTAKELEEGRNWFWMQMRDKAASGGSSVDSKAYNSAASGKNSSQSSASWSLLGLFSGLRWKSWTALLVIFASLYFDMPWLWGVLFLVWVIKDLKNRRTYLMEDIPRSESPLLYWIIIILWLFFAIYSLSWAPWAQPYVEKYMASVPQVEEVTQLIKDKLPAETEPEKAAPEAVNRPQVSGSVSQPGEPPSAARQTLVQRQAPAAPKPTPKKLGPKATLGVPTITAKPKVKPTPTTSGKIVSDSKFDMSVQMPEKWQSRRKSIPGGIQIDMEAPGLRASLSMLGMNLGKPFTMSQFIGMMEREIAVDMPFVRADRATNMNIQTKSGIRMVFREYAGVMNDAPVKAIIGYGVDNKQGYSLIGVYGNGDAPMKQTVLDSISSFSLR